MWRFLTREIVALALKEQLDGGIELDLTVFGAAMTATAQENEILRLVGVLDFEVVCVPKHSHRDDVMNLQLAFGTVVAAVLADFVAFTRRRTDGRS